MSRIRRRRPELLDDPETANEAADRSHGPDAKAGERAFADAVAHALGRLPKGMATAVELIDVDGLAYVEAAGALGVSVGTVMSRLHRGRKRIRARLVAAVTIHEEEPGRCWGE